MKKFRKIVIIVLVILAVIVAAVVIGGKFAVDYVFDKVSNEVITQQIKNEKKAAEDRQAAKIIGEDGTEYVAAREDDEETIEVKGQDGKTHKVKPKSETPQQSAEKPSSSTEKAVKTLSELTPQQLSEIQAMVTTEDKMRVIGMCKAALTADDKREIKAMLESGNIDYGRCKAILAARLSAAQKQQIYAYYDKYINLYFYGE